MLSEYLFILSILMWIIPLRFVNNQVTKTIKHFPYHLIVRILIYEAFLHGHAMSNITSLSSNYTDLAN
jgi:hypothetical protein